MSDEVSQFLEQVERLRGQQIEEDEVRARELEEYMAAKRERQARREGESYIRHCMDGVEFRVSLNASLVYLRLCYSPHYSHYLVA